MASEGSSTDTDGQEEGKHRGTEGTERGVSRLWNSVLSVTPCFKKGFWKGAEEGKHKGTEGTERGSRQPLELCPIRESMFQ